MVGHATVVVVAPSGMVVVVMSEVVVVVPSTVVDVEVLVVWAMAYAAVKTTMPMASNAMPAAARNSLSPGRSGPARLMVITNGSYPGPGTAEGIAGGAPVNDLQTLPPG